MKKTIALAAGLAGMALSPAFAQSSVTLYGIMDAGLAHVSDIAGSNSTQLRSGNLYTSRFGFRGAEDLGGGLKAVFNLEAGLSADTGATSTPFFNRQSWLGLRSDSFGDITLGRMLPTINDLFIASLQASYFGNPSAAIDGAAVGAGSSAARFNNMLGGTRVDNAIKYQTPNFGGFRGHAMAALGEVAGSSSAGRILSLGGSYASNSFDAGLVYHERECSEASGCPAGKSKDKILGVGGAYKFSGNRLGVIYTQQKNALNVQGNDADVLSLLARAPLGQWVVQAGFQFLNDKTVLNQDVRQLNLGANYLLSKRTQLYALYSHQSVKNGGKAGMYSSTSSDDKQGQISLGIAHTF
ncbi:porin [Alicycliphilus denitrificans]|uniref:Porin n=1 Tax=Alicycliphilus denitrificans TaxID=179636 RepID=A0A3R7EC19_9BURK|nr:porin [Alicycliphilus denitrificans]RKJ95065.1 porin [Alicycliphilus denitrificans]